MIVIIVERATPGLRGQLTRWMLEVRAGVFVGTLSTRVRDKLWTIVKARNSTGGSLLIARAQNEQGFVVETHGDTSRQVLDIEGLFLVHKPNRLAAAEPESESESESESTNPPGRSGSRQKARSRSRSRSRSR